MASPAHMAANTSLALRKASTPAGTPQYTATAKKISRMRGNWTMAVPATVSRWCCRIWRFSHSAPIDTMDTGSRSVSTL